MVIVYLITNSWNNSIHIKLQCKLIYCGNASIKGSWKDMEGRRTGGTRGVRTTDLHGVETVVFVREVTNVNLLMLLLY